MKAGGERVITIPSRLGYGSKGSGAEIPPDLDLVFEVKVLKVGLAWESRRSCGSAYCVHAS